MLTALRSDRGFTLIEASVSMLIMGILLAAVYSVIIRVNQEAAEQVALADTQRALRNAAQVIDVELRQANADVNNGNEVQARRPLPRASGVVPPWRHWLPTGVREGYDEARIGGHPALSS